MARDEAMVLIMPRVPKALHKRVRLHCMAHEITMAAFVTAAITERLRRERRRRVA